MIGSIGPQGPVKLYKCENCGDGYMPEPDVLHGQAWVRCMSCRYEACKCDHGDHLTGHGVQMMLKPDGGHQSICFHCVKQLPDAHECSWCRSLGVWGPGWRRDPIPAWRMPALAVEGELHRTRGNAFHTMGDTEDFSCPGCAKQYQKCGCKEREHNAHFHANDMRNGSVAGGKMSYCQTCFWEFRFVCAYCRTVKLNADKADVEVSTDPDNDEHYAGACKKCAEGLLKCPCGKVFRKAPYQEPGADGGFCTECRRVGQHNAPPELKFHAPEGKFDGLYLGVELEVECGEQDRNVLCAMSKQIMKGKAIVKHDGSLMNGLEIVTSPGWIGWQRETWDPFFKWQAKEHKLRSHDTTTCGLHVHISRNVLKEDQIERMVHFIHDPENREFIKMVSGRPPGRYQDYSAPKLKPFNYKVRDDKQNRYTALNLCNDATVEFRLFKGTLNPGTFFARLEFALALTRYCDKVLDITHQRFLRWLLKHEETYPSLTSHLRYGGLLDEVA